MSREASATLDDALVARAAGMLEIARAILAAIDKGRGLRTVLRAAAASEARDEEELGKLLPSVTREQPPWQLPLQVAAALEAGPSRDATRRAGQSARRTGVGARLAERPCRRRTRAASRVWSILLFEDAALARTVAARDLSVPHIQPDNDAIAPLRVVRPRSRPRRPIRAPYWSPICCTAPMVLKPS